MEAKAGGGARLIILLHYDLTVENFPSLSQHVEVKLRKH